MRLETLAARGFRNLEDLELAVPPGGAVLLGANAQGKSNLLEAIAYPVLFRSFRGAGDSEVARSMGPGFRLEAAWRDGERHGAQVTWRAEGRRKEIELDGVAAPRLADSAGRWLSVAFLPGDVALAAGGASDRRAYLDRTLALAEPGYLRALIRYREALRQRSSALRAGRAELARAFDAPLAAAGAELVGRRVRWADGAARRFSRELEELGEEGGGLRYTGDPALSDPAAWPGALARVAARDRARGVTTVGPHRDDLALTLGGRSLRAFGSTGQQRTAAVALKLLDFTTLAEARGSEPALLLDDVFAELDGERQGRLARRLARGGDRQVFVTAPRRDELPPGLGLPVWTVVAGRIAP